VEQPTVTIDLIDKGALSLLRDMERLNLIRVNSAEKTAAAPEGRLSERFAGALRLSARDAALPEKSRGQSRDEAFRRALRRAYGAWADKPWENAAADINALRDEWEWAAQERASQERASQEWGSFESGLDFAGIFDSDREDAFIIEQLKADARRKTEERLAEWEKTGVDPLTRFSGCFKDIFPEGGLKYQRRMRDEWPD
jgi:hypothetical protein